ncbi:MAG: TetR/AcrR family transcriptional regulator, partial [Acidimicrobiia bacterium]
MGRNSDTRDSLLEAAQACLRRHGMSGFSTRRVAEEAGVPLSQIHYHFGSKRRLMLSLLERENARLLQRQATMYGEDLPLWKQWEQACDYLDEDLASGYVRILQEMIAAGWSDQELAEAVRRLLSGWFELLTGVAGRAAGRLGGVGPLTADQIAALVGTAFLGSEAVILLGFSEDEVPARSALRRVGTLIRSLEEE